MKSYTGKGDGGQTWLGNGECKPKSHAIFHAMGAIDKLSCIIGISCAQEGVQDEQLEQIQTDLFDAGAIVSNAIESEGAAKFDEKLKRLEKQIDEIDAKLPPLKHFILPGGTKLAAGMHHARAVCREAERRVQALEKEDFAPVLKYLNRLSSYFFARARWENMKFGVKEKEWKN